MSYISARTALFIGLENFDMIITIVGGGVEWKLVDWFALQASKWVSV